MSFAVLEGAIPPFEESVIGVACRDKDGEEPYKALGSGFIVGPYLAVTARHVIEGVVQEYYGKMAQLPGGMLLVPSASRFKLFAFHQENNTDERVFLVDLVSLSDFSDFAVLRLQPLFDCSEGMYTWRPLLMHAMPVHNGLPVKGMGYVIKHVPDPEGGGMTYRREFWHATGVVKNTYMLKRDRMMDFPCFETNAPFKGGMSGGPVFAENGFVCGTIVSNMEPAPDDRPETEHWSHATVMWPLLANSIECYVRGAKAPYLYSMAELNEIGHISMLDTEGISVTYGGTGMVSAIRSRPNNKGADYRTWYNRRRR